MGMKLNQILLLLLMLAISGCYGRLFGDNADESIFAPKPLGLGNPNKDSGSPVYQQGFDDGCKTGLATMVSDAYKSFYGFKQDPYMVDNPVYYKAWKDAYQYCRQYAFRFTWDPIDKTSNKSLDNPLCIICESEQGR